MGDKRFGQPFIQEELQKRIPENVDIPKPRDKCEPGERILNVSRLLVCATEESLSARLAAGFSFVTFAVF